MLRVCVFVAALALGLLSSGVARAAREIRLALVITNNLYDNTARLAAAHTDGANIRRALEQVGFSSVDVVQDATKEAMSQAIVRFVQRLKAANEIREADEKVISFFYFAGHGGADAKFLRNYIFPRDVRPDRSEDLDRTAIKVEDVVEWIADGQPAASFLVFDACRDIAGENEAEGLQKGYVDVLKSPGRSMISRQRTLIGYAAEFGETTRDTNFLSQELSSSLINSANEATLAFQEVRRAVVQRSRATGYQQTPVVQDRLEGPVYFRVGAAEAVKRPLPVPDGPIASAPAPGPDAISAPPVTETITTSEPIRPADQFTLRPSPTALRQETPAADNRPPSGSPPTTNALALVPGSAVVTSFSGTTIGADGRRSIDTGGVVARIVDLGTGQSSGRSGLLTAGQIGQVFGAAVDAGDPRSTARGGAGPSVFLAATSAFGLQIVARDAGGGVRPMERGGPAARWADGQFGERNNGGPGSVWKVDAATGRVQLFADIHLDGLPNGGAGLGQLAFDLRTRQLFLSDLSTGMIHRLSTQGDELGRFDHGFVGRPGHRLAPIPFDRAGRVTIASPAFDPSQPSTWGFAAAGRRVWGLAVHRDRLFYAVSEGPQVWSVGIRADGTFAADPRLELDIKGLAAGTEIPQIGFDREENLYVATLPELTVQRRHDSAGKPEVAAIMRFKPLEASAGAGPRWSDEPEEIYNDLVTDPGNLGPGLAFGYGVDSSGQLDETQCQGSLWSTAWRDRPEVQATAQVQDGQPDQREARMLLRWSLTAAGAKLGSPDRAFALQGPPTRGRILLPALGSIAPLAPCREPGAAQASGPRPTSLLPPSGPSIPAIATGPSGGLPSSTLPAGARPPFAQPAARPGGGPLPGQLPSASVVGATSCMTVKAASFRCVNQAWEAELQIEDSSGEFLDSLRASSLAFDNRVEPGRQRRPTAADPFRIRFGQAQSGSSVRFDVCLFDEAASRNNMPFRCCRARIDVELPRQACGQSASR